MRSERYFVEIWDVIAGIFFRFVFMALMEYCLVNIVLGDTALPKPIPLPPPPAPPQKPEKVFDLSPPKVRNQRHVSIAKVLVCLYVCSVCRMVDVAETAVHHVPIQMFHGFNVRIRLSYMHRYQDLNHQNQN